MHTAQVTDAASYKPQTIMDYNITKSGVDTVCQCEIHIQVIATHGSGQQQCPFINKHGGNQRIHSLLFSIQKFQKPKMNILKNLSLSLKKPYLVQRDKMKSLAANATSFLSKH